MKCKPSVLTLLICFTLLLGCSNGVGSGDPVIPGEPEVSYYVAGNLPDADRHLWGLWDVFINTETNDVDVIPLRTAQFNLNVVCFLQPPMETLQSLSIHITGIDIFDEQIGIDCDVSLTHPYPDFPSLTGFDVRCIFINHGPAVDKLNTNLRYAYKAEGAAILANPDGYTRWWNYPEFSGGDMAIFGFVPGVIGNLSEPSATLNPFKYFATDLGEHEDLENYFSETANVENRGTFVAGTSATRYYQLMFPVPDNPGIKFQYAVDASWVKPDQANSGDPSAWDLPGDFPPEANQHEPITIRAEHPYYSYYIYSQMPVELDIEVFSWQALDPGTGMIDIGRIVISACEDCDGWPVEEVFEGAALEAARVPGSGTAISSVWQVEIGTNLPTAAGNMPFLVTVEPAIPASYDQGFGQPAPNDDLAAYQVGLLITTDSTMSCVAPDINFALIHPLAAEPDDPVIIDASDSHGTGILKYYWDFENDGVYDLTTYDDPVVEHTYTEEGTYEVMIKVENHCPPFIGVLDEPLEVLVSNDCFPAVAHVSPTGPVDVKVEHYVHFSLVGTEGTGPFFWLWDWDDGQGYAYESDELQFTHQFNELGTFNVMVRAINGCGSDPIDQPVVVNVNLEW